MNLDKDTKIKALNALMEGHRLIKQQILGDIRDQSPEYIYNITVSNQITNILLILYNIRIQRPGEIPAMETKAKKKRFMVQYKAQYAIASEEAMNLWERAVSTTGLEYRIQEI